MKRTFNISNFCLCCKGFSFIFILFLYIVGNLYYHTASVTTTRPLREKPPTSSSVTRPLPRSVNI